MRWGMKAKRRCNIYLWNPWFAWYPVRCHDQWPDWQYRKWVWLETIYTRYKASFENDYHHHWNYSFLPGKDDA